MSNPPKNRPRFQIHLSTAIVLMFVAGGFLWANTYVFDRSASQSYWSYIDETGWPLTYSQSMLGLHRFTVSGGYFSPICLAVDAIIALASLCAICFVCEWLIDHRTEASIRTTK